MSEICPVPQGSLILRTLAMPADTNVNGDIFGGWIMSQMDIAGGILAKEIARCRTVTVAVNSIKFIQPVKVGDIVGCYGSVVKIGNTSLTLNLEVWIEPILRATDGDCAHIKVTEADFTYVAIDNDGQKKVIDKENYPSGN
ncbi:MULTISPECIES: acyl-CoA thioester hydrolase YciA [Corallincola]|uniref:Acyl-CoA thioester hydrolase YciA n=3 Tax=Corallincola TaxID=1775176 RepID=A0A368NFD0_9GAMM|nr:MULTISPECIES: acyl-CoA thioester hydrolase YciA [Corallincola]RCU49282.1 acyl-CoA thioester hydrolase YciA [Corallincola holothuriorum]TAA47516.1 acyl-CoA thioester hydrolase YciA [Corallincola spongiicola]TCI05198.1 acyl-CoA thioester hydrolase YciA [Corallincola luteus]